MEYVIAFGVQFVVAWVLCGLIVMLGGSFLDLGVGDVKDLIWKSGVIAAATVAGLLLNMAFMIPVPFFAPWIWPALFVGIAVSVLFEVDAAEDWQTIGLFLALYLGSLMLAMLGLAMVLGTGE